MKHRSAYHILFVALAVELSFFIAPASGDCSGSGPLECYDCTGDRCKTGCAKGESCKTSVFINGSDYKASAASEKLPNGCVEMGPPSATLRWCFCNANYCNAAVGIHRTAATMVAILLSILLLHLLR